MLALVRSRPEFRRLFLAHTVSRAGDAFNTVALVVLVFRLTGSGRGVAATVAFEVVPVLLFGPVAGLAADRFSRRRLMIGSDLARMGIVAALVLEPGSLALAFAVAFAVSTATLAFNPAASSLLPEVVEPEELVTANSALWTTAVAAQIVLAPVAGAVIAAFGVRIAFALNAASYLGSAALLFRLAAGRRPATLEVRGWRGLGGGIAVVRAHPLLARLVIVQMLASLSAGATGGLLVVLAEEALGVGPAGFGSLLGAIGVGALIGPLLLRRFIRAGDRRWLFGPFAVRGGVDLLLSTAGNPLVAGASLAVYGMSTSTGMVAYQSTLQSVVPPAQRGRAFALYDVVWNGTRLVSLGLGGWAADFLGIRAVYAAGGVLLLLAAAVGLSGRPGDQVDQG